MVSSDIPADYPTFKRRFGTENACRDHLFKLKWPDGFRCRACGGAQCYRLSVRYAYECSACGCQNALLAGTMFEQTKKPLTTWFSAIYWFIGSKGGMSALELKRHMGFKSDQTAWTWLHKLRRAVAVPGAPLEGSVEVDETMLGGPEPGKRGRGAGGKSLIACAVETHLEARTAPDPSHLSGAALARAEALAARLAAAPGELRRYLKRIRLAVVANASAEALGHFIDAAVAGDAAIATDGWAAYRKGSRGRSHKTIVVSKSEGKAHDHLPAVHLVFTLLKRKLAGTYHGGIGRHLPAYLDEYVFRFNRKSLAPVRNAFTVIARAMAAEPLTNRMIFQRN